MPAQNGSNSSSSSSSSSTKARRQAHSHAARVAHARARRLQVASYMHQKSSAGHDSDREESDHQLASWTRQHTRALLSQHETALPAPRTLSGAFEHEPLASFLRSLAPREHFLLSHYVRVVLPYMCAQCPIMQHFTDYHDYMRRNWVIFSSADIDLLKGFLLASCRHLSLVQFEEEYADIAIRYKLAYIQGLREIISTEDPSLGRIAVSKALVLAFDDLMIGDLSMAAKHIGGALEIVQMAGGFQALGSSAFISYIFSSCIYGKRLLDLDPKVRGSAVSLELESVWT